MSDFGKDHWSLLGYVETLCVEGTKEGIGTIDYRRMRVNEKTHPLLSRAPSSLSWQPTYGSRLKGYWKPDKTTDPLRRLDDHDDVDCLDDLADEGLVEILSLVNGYVTLTDRGREIALRLRAHKSKGGHFATFDLSETVAS